jgi:uncharacterized protein YukE
MPTTHGATPELLESLGRTLQQQMDTVTTMMQTVERTIANTPWTGPAKDRFMNDWNGPFKQALTRLNSAFDAAGQDCVKRAANVRATL